MVTVVAVRTGAQLTPGGGGDVAVVNGVEFFDGSLSPTELRAATLNRYVAPGVSPVIAWDVYVDKKMCGVCGARPMYGVTTYPVIGSTPKLLGAVHDTIGGQSSLTEATTANGGVGGLCSSGVAAWEKFDSGPPPFAFDAVTVK